MLEIKKRGRRKSDNSTVRHEKSGILAQIQSDLNKSQLTYFEATGLALQELIFWETQADGGRLFLNLFFRMIVWAVQPKGSECGPLSGS